MELKLQLFIDSITTVIFNRNLDLSNPVVFKLTDGTPGSAEKYAVVASSKEPVNLLMPINGIWLDYDPRSKYYRQALRLVGLNGEVDSNVTVSPDSVASDDGLIHSWVAVKRYDDLFAAQNIYYLQGPEGPRGPKGPPGPEGAPGPLDYDPIIQEAIARVNAALLV